MAITLSNWVNAIPYCGNFGNGHPLFPPQLDWYIIAGFTLLIYSLALFAYLNKVTVEEQFEHYKKEINNLPPSH